LAEALVGPEGPTNAVSTSRIRLDFSRNIA